MALPVRSEGILVEFQPMSPEEIERTMQFLVRQQASHDATLERLSAKTDRIAEGLIGVTGLLGRVTESFAEQILDLRKTQKETAEGLRNSQAKLDDLGEYIKTVESHLDVVIEMFERHLREDHGPRPS